MACITNVVSIQCPPLQVFRYVTIPVNWPSWHPSSLRVSGATDHPLSPGEQVVEDFLVAGRRGRVMWTVRQCQAPEYWSIEGQGEHGNIATITYTLTPQGKGTRFERRLEYTMPTYRLALLDCLLLRRRIRAESTEALRRLQDVLGNVPAAAQENLG